MPRNPDKRRCSARKTNGDPCGHWAIRGGTVCAHHGGRAPQVRAAATANARRTDALRRAGRMVARLGVDMDPAEHLLDSLHIAAQHVAVWGLMVDSLDAASEDQASERGELRGELSYRIVVDESGGGGLSVSASDRLLAFNSHGLASLHPYVLALERAVDRHARIAKLCLDAGIAEAQMRLREREAQMIADLLRAVFSDPELAMSAAGQRAALVVAARHLRALPAG